ncbi:hypothetical protein QR680_011289 [Steinernema hermaphroditum]|uniref:Uncharacterized protein n=1 Tax=Steinernema hermaphroditum TaxID=289476 RepID=A0AA39IRS1_9BILA|nr:hypothetical protein QR680_011289 [Steinernema hermaphroditum]
MFSTLLPLLPLLFHLSRAFVSFRGLPDESLMEPEFEMSNQRGSFAFGRVRHVEDLSKPTLTFNAAGHEMTVPKGMYQYTDRQRDFDSNFRLPDFQSPFDLSGEMKSKDNQINGFYLPMPYGMEPVNIQVVQERERDNALGGSINSDDPLAEALAGAKKLCAKAATVRCDEALQHYYKLRAKQAAEEEAPVVEKMFKLADTVSATGYKNEEQNGLGVLFGLPGMEPMFWQAKLRRFNNNNVKMRVQP